MMQAYEPPYPHRVDLKLPLDGAALDDRLAVMGVWFNEVRPKGFTGPVVPYDTLGYTHLTGWFDRFEHALAFKLAFGGK